MSHITVVSDPLKHAEHSILQQCKPVLSHFKAPLKKGKQLHYEASGIKNTLAR